MLSRLLKKFKSKSNPQKAVSYQRFFKTGPGQYGEGDLFLGVTVPQQRILAKEFKDLPLNDIKTLLKSKYHEHRLTSLFILIHQFNQAEEKERDRIVEFYCSNRQYINNWDLVDSSAAQILGTHLLTHPNEKNILYEYVKSNSLWDRRIAIIATFAFIKKSKFDDTINMSLLLLQDEHDLMHKAVGWMLREVGKKEPSALKSFLNAHAPNMPRTALRYAIEKFDATTRKHYLALP